MRDSLGASFIKRLSREYKGYLTKPATTECPLVSLSPCPSPQPNPALELHKQGNHKPLLYSEKWLLPLPTNHLIECHCLGHSGD